MSDQDYEAGLAAQRAEWLKKQAAEKLLRERRKIELAAKHAEEHAAREREAAEKELLREAARNQLFEMIAAKLQQHGTTLLRKRQMLITRDDYGNVLTEKWQNEMKYFVSAVLLRDAALNTLFDQSFNYHSQDDSVQFGLEYAERLYSNQIDCYLDEIEAYQFDDRDKGLLDAIEQANPVEFELLCGVLLSRHGWHVIPVGGTGDHGADLIGERSGVRVAFQCKKYGTPVGNSAVQEALAGKVMHQADLAVVIAMRGYTAAAHELAQAAHVHLIGVTDLPSFHTLIGIE